MAEPVTVVVSVDAEEDNWKPAREPLTLENIRELPRLDRVLEQLGARATYFTTWPVAATAWSAEIARGLAATGRAEVGAHLHPWNTPPDSYGLEPRMTMLSNLPPSLQRAKIRVLTDELASVLGERPYSFRAGRWGLDATTVEALIACGYRVDSSVTPFKSWSEDQGPSHVGAPLDVYRLGGRPDHRVPVPDGPLIEVPTSWGYMRNDWTASERLTRALDAPPLRRLRLIRLAERLHVMNSVVLSPELDSIKDMVTLAHRLLERGVRHLHLTLHSPSLRAGLNPFAATQADVERIFDNLSRIIDRIGAMTSVRFATVGEAGAMLAPAV